MIQFLPAEIFDWVNAKGFNLVDYYNDNPIGCFLEIDLNYSYKMHDLHNDYPVTGEKIKNQNKFCQNINKKS